MSEEYEEDCPECGFNQKDQDERDKKLIGKFIQKMEFIELKSENPKKMAREYKIEYEGRLNK